MRILRALSLAGVAAVAYGQPAVRPEVVEVRGVADGHTIEIAGGGRVRLAGIRAPRPPRRASAGDPFGREARDRLEGMLTHRFVRIERPSPGSLTAAYVLLEDGTFVNAVLVREGLATVAGRPSGARGGELLRAQEQARAARRGLWGARVNAQRRNSATPNERPTRNAQNSQGRKATLGFALGVPSSSPGCFGRYGLGVDWALGVAALGIDAAPTPRGAPPMDRRASRAARGRRRRRSRRRSGSS